MLRKLFRLILNIVLYRVDFLYIFSKDLGQYFQDDINCLDFVNLPVSNA